MFGKTSPFPYYKDHGRNPQLRRNRETMTATPDQKVALLFGGGRGMGAASARALHKAGWRLALSSPSESCEKLAAELGAFAVRGSMDSPDDIKRVVAAAREHCGRIDGLLIHSGGPPKGDLLALSDDDWRRGVDLLLLGFVRAMREVVPVMREGGGGSVVAITAYGAAEPSLVFPISSAVRASVSAMVRLYATRFGADGIRVNGVMPGFVDSLDFGDSNPAADSALGRLGRADELGETVAFLMSDGAGYITGQNILADGGLTHGI